MMYSKVVIAAFLGLLSAVAAAPIDARTGSSPAKNPKGSGPGTVSVLSGDNDDGLVLGSGNGGMGGTNFDDSGAEAITSITSDGEGPSGGGPWGHGGKGGGHPSIITNAGNSVKQGGNGGDGSAVGSYGSNNKFHSRGQSNTKGPKKSKPSNMKQPPTNPSVSVLSNDNDDGLVVASGNGGPGGYNTADTSAYAESIIDSEGGMPGGLPSPFTNAGNSVKQGGNGGSGSAVGTYGSNNKFESRGKSTKPQQGPSSPGSISVLSNDNDDGATILSGNGGAGGINDADEYADAETFTDNSPSGGGSPIGCRTESCKSPKKGGPQKQPSGGQPIITNAGNNVKQGGNGGSGSAVGTYGSNNSFKGRRTSSQPPASNNPSISVLSNDNDDGIVAASGNGGPGGMNIAYQEADAETSTSNGGGPSGGTPIGCRSGSCSPKKGPQKQPSGGKPVIITNAGNKVKQGGNGGNGAAVGSYGSNNQY